MVYFKTYYPAAFTSIALTLYPVLQEKQLTAPKIYTLLLINTIGYYVTITDTLPPVVVDDVFLINDYSVVLSNNATALFTL